MTKQLKEIFSNYSGDRSEVIPILQKIQNEFGFLPEEAINEVSSFLNISRTEIYGIATFYAQFRFTRPGKHVIKVCLGTACHVKGGERIMDTIKNTLNLPEEGTTPDYLFSVERVACIGCCALAPCAVIDNKVHAKLTSDQVVNIIAKTEAES